MDFISSLSLHTASSLLFVLLNIYRDINAFNGRLSAAIYFIFITCPIFICMAFEKFVSENFMAFRSRFFSSPDRIIGKHLRELHNAFLDELFKQSFGKCPRVRITNLDTFTFRDVITCVLFYIFIQEV